MEKLSILFLSCLIISFSACSQNPVTTADCSNNHYRDSLVEHYIRNGAEKLPDSYNNPRWGLYCDSVLMVCPNTAEAYQLKAIPSLKGGDYETAFRLNDKAVELEPRNYLDYRAFLKCIFTKDYNGSITDFKEAEKLSPKGGLMDHSYSFFIGLCYMELGRYQDAEEYFKKDITMQTGGDSLQLPHFNSLFYTGLLYYRMSQFSKAKKYLEDCVGVYEQHPEANYYLAMIAGQEGNKAQKIRYLDIAKKALRNGYRLNEDNIYYANYPGQITIHEISNALQP
ncbi:MAG: tetratricopeptide repeat protein [Chitinophagaceae bacterium]